MTDILFNALLAGLILAAVCGPLGTLVIWQRMAFYGDTLAHSALLGLAVGVALEVNLHLAVLLVCLLVALLLFLLQGRRAEAADSYLGILSHSSLALGLVCLALLDRPGINLEAFLFGDLLAVMDGDLIDLGVVGGAALLCLWRYWRPMVAVIAHEELAALDGIPVQRLKLLMMVLIAATVAIAMKIVGVLLVTAMLIIPASAASRVSRSPEQSAVLAMLCGMLAVGLGLAAAWRWDTPAGPSIVLCAALLFLLAQCLPLHKRLFG